MTKERDGKFSHYFCLNPFKHSSSNLSPSLFYVSRETNFCIEVKFFYIFALFHVKFFEL